jgi:hypothetical protein
VDNHQIAVQGGDHHLPHVGSQPHSHQTVRVEHLIAHSQFVDRLINLHPGYCSVGYIMVNYSYDKTNETFRNQRQNKQHPQYMW